QPVLDQDVVLSREGPEHARLAGVGVSDQRHAQHRIAPRAHVLPVPLDVFELELESLDPAPNDPAVGLELGLTRTPETDAAPDTRKVGPHAGQPRQEVLELGQLDLEPCLPAPSPGRKDVEDDLGPVHHPDLELALEIRSLYRREL